MKLKHQATVVVGRFQLPHIAHIGLIKTAIANGDRTVVLIGSAFHARTIKNCFTWTEVESMIRLCLTDEENRKTTFVPIRDYNDNAKWFEVARKKVREVIGDEVKDVAVFGHFKDASSAYLSQMPWPVEDAGCAVKIDATALRKMLFTSEFAGIALSAMEQYVPWRVIEYLKAWSVLPFLGDMKAEYEKIQREQKEYGSAYGLTADFVLEFEVEDDDTYVLLVERGRWPGKGLLAIPGGFYDPSKSETLFQCALREALEETQHNIWEKLLRESFVGREFFDAPGRSVRNNIMTMAHHFKMRGKELPSIRESADPGEAFPKFVRKGDLASLENRFFDDHFGILHKMIGFEIED